MKSLVQIYEEMETDEILEELEVLNMMGVPAGWEQAQANNIAAAEQALALKKQSESSQQA